MLGPSVDARGGTDRPAHCLTAPIVSPLTRYRLTMATGVVILLPMVTFGVIVKKYLVSGLTMGAVKQ